jgi:putative DNA primase/helicase
MEVYADGHYHCYVCGAHGDVEQLPETTQATVQASATGARQTSVDTLKRGIELWQAAKPVRDTLAERYLTEIRRLDLAILPDLDAVLRFHPRCPFDKDKHPCVIALFRDVESDEIAGIHRIALTANAEKIGRMILGSWPNPRAIKLRQTSGKKLIIGEGIETTIAGGMRASKTTTLWAMGSAIAIGRLPVITKVIKLMILVDRDKSDVGISNAKICAQRWCCAQRRCVLLCPQQDDTDFNDLVGEKQS